MPGFYDATCPKCGEPIVVNNDNLANLKELMRQKMLKEKTNE